MSTSQWGQLVLLSVLWGGTFLFVGIAIREVPPLTLVLVRVGVAMLVLVPLVLQQGLSLPSTAAGWLPFAVMALLNNVIPFTLIATAQQEITSGLASVLNATTPLWSALLAVLVLGEGLKASRLAGLLVGVAGVAILIGPEAMLGRASSLVGIMCMLAGTLSYGFSAIWGRRLREVPPLKSAACQVTCSTLLLLPLAGLFDAPWQLALPSLPAIASLIAMGVLSTAVAYIIFFRILTVSGPQNVMLVTLLIPVSGMALGALVLGEEVLARHVLGAVVIAISLVLIDGRIVTAVVRRLGRIPPNTGSPH